MTIERTPINMVTVAHSGRLTTLFRPEVLAAQHEPELGSLLAIQPISTKLLTLTAVALTVGLTLLAFRGEYTRKAHVSGYLVPSQGLIKVYSRETGTIVEKSVTEGQRVSKGDVLFVVSMERRSSGTTEAQGDAMTRVRERTASLKGELWQQRHIAQIETGELRTRMDAMESEVVQLGDEIATQERRVANARAGVQRYEQLFAQSLVSAQQIEDAQKDLLEQQSKFQALQRDRMAAARDLDTIKAALSASDLKAQTQRAAIGRSISSLDQELTEYESRRTLVVTAPEDGTATAVLADRGQTANPSQPLVSILPAQAVLQAHLFVASRSIGFITEGQTVALQYQAFPFQRFGSHSGRVTEISRTLIMPGEAALAMPLSEPAYRVTVTLDAQAVRAYQRDFPLQAGMLLDANIWLDRRKLYEWVLDPLYSVTGKV